MAPLIQHTVRFPVTPELLFEMYVDSRKHSASTGAAAKLSRKTADRLLRLAEQFWARTSWWCQGNELCSCGVRSIGRNKTRRCLF